MYHDHMNKLQNVLQEVDVRNVSTEIDTTLAASSSRASISRPTDHLERVVFVDDFGFPHDVQIRPLHLIQESERNSHFLQYVLRGTHDSEHLHECCYGSVLTVLSMHAASKGIGSAPRITKFAPGPTSVRIAPPWRSIS